MTTKTELLALAERVEAWGGTEPVFLEDDCRCFGKQYEDQWFAAVLSDSLDAAKALHDALLPKDRCVLLEQNFFSWTCHITEYRDEGPACVGQGTSLTSPAAAWVAAILRAKAEEIK